MTQTLFRLWRSYQLCFYSLSMMKSHEEGRQTEEDRDFCSPNVKGLPSPDSDNTYTCPCKEGYTGLRCETDIDECASSPCVHGKCKDMVNAYKCNCNPGYTGVNCETDINECQSNPCVNGTCEDKVNSYKCNCIPGFTGTNCEQDIDECSSNPCKNAGICSNLVDAYNCTCASRYHGTNCENKLGPCDVNPCANGGTCTELSDENFECACLPGHYWSKCEFHAYASNDYKTADDADNDCKSRGMELAMIFQSSVNKLLKGLHQSDFWIGLKKVNGGWKWPNGTELDENVYSKWNSQIGSNNCVKMDPSNGKWKSDPCTNSRPFVCTSYKA